MTATARLPGCLAVQRDEFCHPHYTEGCQQQNKTVVSLGNLSPPWEVVTSFMDISVRFFATNPCILAKCIRSCYTEGIASWKPIHDVLKQTCKMGLGPAFAAGLQRPRQGHPPNPAMAWPRAQTPPALCCHLRGALPWAPLVARMTYLRHLSHNCSSHVF